MSRVTILILTVAALVAGALVSTAGANHIPGATYTGTGAFGIGVEFTVSGDGAAVTTFKATNVPGNTCTFTEMTFTGTFPISTGDPHAFAITSGGSSVNGTFQTTQGAQGTLRLQSNYPPCQSDTLTWTATTTATPPPPPPPPAKPCVVPKVVGLLLPTARTKIRRAGCTTGRIRHARSKVRRNHVVSQSPHARVTRPRGTRVNLVVSRGR